MLDWPKKLEQNGYVQIPNFLPYDKAKDTQRQLQCFKNGFAWDLMTSPYYPLSAIKDRISSNHIDKQRHRQAVKALKRKQFSFSFYRSSNKHKSRHQQDRLNQIVVDALNSSVCPELEVKGDIIDVFFAAFTKGQFLTYHSDGAAGKYAFVYQLSSGWQKKYGGELVLYPKKIKFYKKFLQPEFNTLTLLKLSHPMFHSVNMLNNPGICPRLTISGWLV